MATTNKYLKGDLPIAISVNIPTALVRYERQDFAADYAIGNTPWISAASDNNRISRLTTTYQKERIDQATTAGENSLSNWWLRGATSWHHGMGERYYDADSSDLYRYYESNNIDIWDLGEAKLLKKMNNYANTYPAKTPATTTNGTFYIANNLVWFYNATTNTAASVSLGSGVVPHVLTTDGGQALVGASNGIYEVTEALVVTKYWNSSTTTWTVQAIGYVKDRIIACIKTTASTNMMQVLELARYPASPVPHNVSAAEIAWTYATADLTFNSIASFPGAIAVAYTIGAISRIQAYTLTPGSLLAGLDDPYIIAELPRGELLNQVRSYLNEYVVLATTEGIRVGNLGSDGISFTYGSINVEGDCKDIAFNQSYIYGTRGLAVSGTYGAWRIDLGTTLLATYGYTSTATGYAYAADVTTDGNIPNGISFVGQTERKMITSVSGVWVEDATVVARSGYIKSGWIRFGTSEKKQPVSLSVRSSLPVANPIAYLGFNLYDQESHSVDIGSIPIGMTTEVYLAGSLQPADHFEVTFNFNSGSDTAIAGPVLEQWTLRGLPAPLRSRTFTVPLLCYEEEKDSNGVSRTSKPYDRLKYLETIEQNGGAVLFQDFSTGEERICVIRAIQYEQAAPPTFARGFGGIVTLQLQTIDHEDALQ